MCCRRFADVGGKAITKISLLYCEYIVVSILLKIIEGPILAIITLMHSVYNVFENQSYDLA